MEFGEFSGKIAVVKCVINGKDANSNPIYGFCMGVTDIRDLLYHGELFSREPIDTEAPLSELYNKIASPRMEGRSEELAKYENGLAEYITSSRLLQGEKKIADPKAMEHKITYFCSSVLGLNAISFLELQEMSIEDLYLIIPALKKNEELSDAEEPLEEEPFSDGISIGEEKKSTPDVVVACDPILDPVSGVSANELAEGDAIFCKLKEGSVVYNLMKNASADFDGIVSGEVSAVQMNDLGSATVALRLTEGVTGAMRMAGSVRVKIVRDVPQEEIPENNSTHIEIALAIAGVVAFLCVMGLMLHFLS
jgi:hypothetical protein